MLKKIFYYLQSNDLEINNYQVPELWMNYSGNGIFSTSFNDFYLEKIGEILIQDQGRNYKQSISLCRNELHGIGGDWSYHAQVYNAFPRFTSAFDHSGNGDLKDYFSANHRIKKTGTFLKMIAMLPYLKSLGINVLHLMPITQIGKDGNRGDSGSPYAIKNPYQLDENLAETAIPFSVEEQFSALTEACHMLEIRVVTEFVLRTASLDSDWIKQFPEWFYWIKKENANDFTSPEFSKEDLKQIKNIFNGKGEFIAPNESYQNLFVLPPNKDNIELVHGKYYAKTERGEEAVIAGAFADWPPDDLQPAWDDVTYLRMYIPQDAPDNFNYTAYNTLRFYHPELALPENRNQALWDALTGIIPHYQQKFGIDGIMLDMGHALPADLLKEIIEKARNIDPDFGFWEENFEILYSSRTTGFNACLGFEWKFTEHEVGLRNMMITARAQLPLPFFGTPETHNTPRISHPKIKKQYYTLNAFLPSCIPFIHTGYELNEKHPVNTGLNFDDLQLEFYKNYNLPLFNAAALDWTANDNMVEFIQKIALLRQKNKVWIATGDERTLIIHYPENSFGNVIAFERFDAFQPWKSILVVMNINLNQDEKFFLELYGTYNNSYQEYLSDRLYSFEDHWLSTELEAGGILVFELHKLI
ncbi:MAG: alpha-amylase family glycosyl hydrolase [Flavobacteriaceae bacterium]|nr:alpha-amylase family glycosyl hydrolase [Flavobacteriaceae bacterium]